MLFNSPTFIVFLFVVFCLYWAIGRRRPQNVLLLTASYIFYGAWSWKFLLLLMASTLVDYGIGRLLAATPDVKRRRALLIASVAVNLGFLGFFKYYGFFVTQAVDLLNSIGFEAHVRTLQIVLPVGISFYTFQSLGYVVDVYRGKLAAERNLLDYAVFVSFFPQLVAGPIERATHMLPQVKRERTFSGVEFEGGLQLIAWGLFKKIVIADNLAPYVNAVYADPAAYSGTTLLTATVFFAFQIYCDFSGYSDTARGTARTLGFELMRNFDFPYFSRNPVEFWRRWHISLSQWFQDYLYFPLAMRYMRKGGWASKYKAHIISMGLIGLWHGANWTFLLFGLYWGLVIAGYLALSERWAAADDGHWSNRLAGARWLVPISVVAMFAVVSFGWILFRAPSLSQVWVVLTGMFSASGIAGVERVGVLHARHLWLLVGGLYLAEFLYRNAQQLASTLMGGEVRRLVLRHALFGAAVLSYVVAQNGLSQPFIYFQF
jgi:D-alanyl-lipoteichoic acid acyltransferase DltB (MBOAT superfamily)